MNDAGLQYVYRMHPLQKIACVRILSRQLMKKTQDSISKLKLQSMLVNMGWRFIEDIINAFLEVLEEKTKKMEELKFSTKGRTGLRERINKELNETMIGLVRQKRQIRGKKTIYI